MNTKINYFFCAFVLLTTGTTTHIYPLIHDPNRKLIKRIEINRLIEIALAQLAQEEINNNNNFYKTDNKLKLSKYPLSITLWLLTGCCIKIQYKKIRQKIINYHTSQNLNQSNQLTKLTNNDLSSKEV